MVRRKLLLCPAVAAVLLAGSASVAPAIGSRSLPASEAGCTADVTKALIRKFARNYSLGRVSVIDRLWAPEPRFYWFSSGPPGARLGPPAYVRATLASYFRSRVRRHERIRLTEVRARYDPRRKIVNFSGKLVRSADDLPPRPPTDFKGAADCVSGRPALIVWSM